MDWRVVNLSAEDFEDNVLGAIQNLFERIWQAMGTPKEMALFCRSPMEASGVHGSVLLSGVRRSVLEHRRQARWSAVPEATEGTGDGAFGRGRERLE